VKRRHIFSRRDQTLAFTATCVASICTQVLNHEAKIKKKLESDAFPSMFEANKARGMSLGLSGA